MAVALFY